MYTMHDEPDFWLNLPLAIIGWICIFIFIFLLFSMFTCKSANAYMWNDNELGTTIITYDRKCPEGMIPALGQTIDLNKYPRFKKRFYPKKRYLKLEDSRNKENFLRSCLLVE